MLKIGGMRGEARKTKKMKGRPPIKISQEELDKAKIKVSKEQ